MSQESEPLTPPGCDLREFPFMPLDVVRLRDSDITAVSSGDEFRCAVLLWCASWHQVPAASLPDDDIVLAQLAGFGRVVKEWKKVRAGSLRGWLKCADGRLYHPVVAEKANEAWGRKQERAHEKECGRIKKLNQRHNTAIPYPTLEQFLSPNYAPPKAPLVPDLSPGTTEECPQGQAHDVPRDGPHVSPEKTRRQGDGQGQGQGQYLKPIDVPTGTLGNLALPLPAADPVDNPEQPEPAPALALVSTGLSCPIDKLVALYHELMPLNPRCKVLNKQRRSHIAARWKEASKLDTFPFKGGYDTQAKGLACWREFFAICADSDFLTGKARPAPGRKTFVADIDFLMAPEAFAKTLENKYHRE